MADLTKSDVRINQINFTPDEDAGLILTAHYSQDITDGETVISTHSATVNIDAWVDSRERRMLAALIKKLSKTLA